MTHTLEISLKIPSLRVKRDDKPDPETIANGEVRFIKVVELDALPKAGQTLTLSVGPAGSLACEVVRTDWHEDKSMFVAACRYAKRSIPETDYLTLVNAPDWQQRTLI
jgi:hypothetical protein